MTETKAGYIALVGRPNVGKSTILNAFTGEKLSIVTPRAQTTRERVMGIYSAAGTQMVFVDTPGLLEPKYLLQESMLHAARAAVLDADLVLVVLDAADGMATLPEGDALELLDRRRPAFVAINKIDVAEAAKIAALEAWAEGRWGVGAWRISATRGDGIVPLRDALAAALPESPFFYPDDELAVQPVRFFVAELVRETVFEEYEQEIPYSTAVQIEEYREGSEPIYIRASVILERESQKGILVGKGGAAIKKLGRRSREKIEAFLGERVYLDLWVKTQPGWRKKKGALRALGYTPPTE